MQTARTHTPIQDGSHESFDTLAAALDARTMYAEAGHVVGSIANDVDGFGFDVWDLWTEREGLGLADPSADARLHRGEVFPETVALIVHATTREPIKASGQAPRFIRNAIGNRIPGQLWQRVAEGGDADVELDEPVDPREEYDPIDSFESLDN